ncbi:hypothetical protein AB0I53_22710 [Saccharopolyspora sp. NPDC050389]|uniref:hypothetical protein n=1 Tax=Saccharopolyspora sp. NPDC050389 TaxID=3155516 RepID=UPI0033E0C510
MRRPLVTMLLCGLTALAATGTAAAAEGSHPLGLDKLLNTTVLDVSGHDGTSQDGTAHAETSQPAEKPQPPAKKPQE